MLYRFLSSVKDKTEGPRKFFMLSLLGFLRKGISKLLYVSGTHGVINLELSSSLLTRPHIPGF